MLNLVELRAYNGFRERKGAREAVFRLFEEHCSGCGCRLLAQGGWEIRPWFADASLELLGRIYPLIDSANLINQRLLCPACCGQSAQSGEARGAQQIFRTFSLNMRRMRNALPQVQPGHHSLPLGRFYNPELGQDVRAGMGFPLEVDLSRAHAQGRSHGSFHLLPWVEVAAALREAIADVEEAPVADLVLHEVVLPALWPTAVLVTGIQGHWAAYHGHGEGVQALLHMMRERAELPTEVGQWLLLDGPVPEVHRYPFAWLREPERMLCDLINIHAWSAHLLELEFIDPSFCVSRYQHLPRITRITSHTPATLFDFLYALGRGAPRLRAGFVEHNRIQAGNLDGRALERFVAQYHSATPYVVLLREEVRALNQALARQLDSLSEALVRAQVVEDQQELDL